jgi:hypothetical protein
MKKLLLIAVVFFGVTIVTNAQINQGTILVGASSSLGFMSVSPDGGDSYSSFDLDGKAGYFFIDNLAAGVGLNFNKQDEYSSLGFGVFGRYYINGAIITGLGIGATKVDYGSVDGSYTTIALEGGYAAFITKNIAVEPTLNLNLLSGDTDATQFGFNIGFALYLGRE